MTSAKDFKGLVIVIPTKNRRSLLERALQSVLAQAYGAYRVVVINDGSTDDTRAYLESLTDPRIKVVHHEKSLGVNASRNEAFKNLAEGEWAVPLDDDDMFLPGAFEAIARGVAEVPPDVQILCFNTIMHLPDGDVPGGYQFIEGEQYYEPTYETLMTGKGWRMYSGAANWAVFKWTLFPMYLFAADINGFEGEMWILMGRDGIRMRYMPAQIVLTDYSHKEEHLSRVAAGRDPASFVRAYRRILPAHARFYDKPEHRHLGRSAALSGMKLAVRARDPLGFLYCAAWYVRWAL